MHAITTITTSRFQRLAKEGSWIVIGQIAAVAGALMSVRVLTEYLEPAEYGQLALGLTIAGLVNQVVMAGVIAGIGRHYSIATERGDRRGYLHASRRILFIASLAVIGLAVVIMGGLAAANMHHWLLLASAALVFSILTSYNSTLSGIQNAARQRAVVALHSGMDAWMKIGLAVGVMLFLGNNSTAVMLGYALSALFVTISQFLFLKRLIARQEESCYHGTNQNWVRQIWGFSWPFSTWGVFTWAQQVSDRWALDGFATTAEVGQYAVLFQLGYAPIGMLTGLMMMLVGPILYQRSGGAQDASRNISVHHIAWRITQVSFALTVAGFSVAWIFHDWLFRWLVAEAFRETSYLLPWVVLAGGLFAVGQMLALKLMSELCTSSLLTVKVVTALLGTAANVLGAWLYGLEGVVGGLVLFSAIYSAWMLTLAHRLPAAIPTND